MATKTATRSKKFLNPKGAKLLVPTAIEAVASSGGAAAAAYASNSKFGQKLNKKYHGAALFGLGVVLRAFTNEPIVRNIGIGISTIGGLQGFGELMPKYKKDLGLAGLGASEIDYGQFADKVTKDTFSGMGANWEQEARALSNLQLNGDGDGFDGADDGLEGEEALYGDGDGFDGADDGLEGDDWEGQNGIGCPPMEGIPESPEMALM